MSLSLPSILFVKSRLVGTPFEEFAKKLRWFLGYLQRYKYPELWELYLEERWLPVILQRSLTNESCVVDVGCHVGSFLSLVRRYAPNGHHIACEASLTKSEWLKARFPAVKIIPYAVGREAGCAIFEEDTTRPGFSHLLQNGSEPPPNSVRYEVQVCCLDDVLRGKDRIDLIKLDIEGGEFAALQGAREVINKFRPTIIFECGAEDSLAANQLSRKELFDLITGDLNYQIFCFADFVFDKGEMTFDEFRKCGIYPFRAFNFVALPRPSRPGK